MTQTNTISVISDYMFGSPRYHAVSVFSAPFVDEDYDQYDAYNGTYDKNWPLYALHDTEIPKLEITLPNNEVRTITGDLGVINFRDRYASQKVGSKGRTHPFTNTNLQQKEIFYSEYLCPRLTPGWSTLQLFSTESSFGGFVIRCIGNIDSTRNYLAVELEESESGQSITAFPKGIIVNYKDKTYKCKNPTTLYPDRDTSNWSELGSLTNVFNVDIYAIADNGTTTYMRDDADTSRQFIPAQQEDDLICWNVSYYSQ